MLWNDMFDVGSSERWRFVSLLLWEQFPAVQNLQDIVSERMVHALVKHMVGEKYDFQLYALTSPLQSTTAWMM